jgi:hypothetical protein
MKMLAVLAAVSFVGASCSDVVIKVNKKSKQSELSSSTESERAGATSNAEDFLKDMDNLRAVAFDMLMKQIKGQDFQGAVRGAIRDMRSHLVREASKPHNPSLLNFDQSAIKCTNEKLNLDYDQAHKYLGVILKSAVLAKLSEQSSKALNANLSADAAAIAQLILNEVGLKVEGDSKIERDGETVTTSGAFKLSLVPFQDESAELQERDAKESIDLKFSRVAGQGNDGSFEANVSASELASDKTLVTYEMLVKVSRTKVDGKMVYKSSMAVGKKGSDAHLTRSLVIEEVEAKKYRIIDEIASGGVSKQSAFVVDAGALSQQCKIQKDQIKDEDKDKLKGDDKKTLSPDPQPTTEPSPVNPVGQDPGYEEPKKTVDDSDDDQVVNSPTQKPGQNPGQSPGQN